MGVDMKIIGMPIAYVIFMACWQICGIMLGLTIYARELNGK